MRRSVLRRSGAIALAAFVSGAGGTVATEVSPSHSYEFTTASVATMDLTGVTPDVAQGTELSPAWSLRLIATGASVGRELRLTIPAGMRVDFSSLYGTAPANEAAVAAWLAAIEDELPIDFYAVRDLQGAYARTVVFRVVTLTGGAHVIRAVSETLLEATSSAGIVRHAVNASSVGVDGMTLVDAGTNNTVVSDTPVLNSAVVNSAIFRAAGTLAARRWLETTDSGGDYFQGSALPSELTAYAIRTLTASAPGVGGNGGLAVFSISGSNWPTPAISGGTAIIGSDAGGSSATSVAPTSWVSDSGEDLQETTEYRPHVTYVSRSSTGSHGSLGGEELDLSGGAALQPISAGARLLAGSGVMGSFQSSGFRFAEAVYATSEDAARRMAYADMVASDTGATNLVAMVGASDLGNLEISDAIFAARDTDTAVVRLAVGGTSYTSVPSQASNALMVSAWASDRRRKMVVGLGCLTNGVANADYVVGINTAATGLTATIRRVQRTGQFHVAGIEPTRRRVPFDSEDPCDARADEFARRTGHKVIAATQSQGIYWRVRTDGPAAGAPEVPDPTSAGSAGYDVLETHVIGEAAAALAAQLNAELGI